MISIFFNWELSIFFIDLFIFFILVEKFYILIFLILWKIFLIDNLLIDLFVLILDLCRSLLFWLKALRDLNYGTFSLILLRFFNGFCYFLRVVNLLQNHVYLIVHFIYFFFYIGLLKLNITWIYWWFFFYEQRFLMWNLFRCLEWVHFLYRFQLRSSKMVEFFLHVLPDFNYLKNRWNKFTFFKWFVIKFFTNFLRK